MQHNALLQNIKTLLDVKDGLLKPEVKPVTQHLTSAISGRAWFTDWVNLPWAVVAHTFNHSPQEAEADRSL